MVNDMIHGIYIGFGEEKEIGEYWLRIGSASQASSHMLPYSRISGSIGL
jgi:hypothetical protein